MTEFTPVSALIGGSLIGLAAVLLFHLNGRIAGISGIFHGFLRAPSGDRLWRFLFLGGLIGGALLYQLYSGQSIGGTFEPSLGVAALGGLLVGLGTRLGSGCTSGHGVCGIARLSPRSIVATIVFLACGIVTASVVYSVLTP